jgi:hypothetical protein
VYVYQPSWTTAALKSTLHKVAISVHRVTSSKEATAESVPQATTIPASPRQSFLQVRVEDTSLQDGTRRPSASSTERPRPSGPYPPVMSQNDISWIYEHCGRSSMSVMVDRIGKIAFVGFILLEY